MAVRFDEQQAAEVDRLLLDLRADVGRRLDKAEAVRAAAPGGWRRSGTPGAGERSQGLALPRAFLECRKSRLVVTKIVVAADGQCPADRCLYGGASTLDLNQT
jgi:hypothetical protein